MTGAAVECRNVWKVFGERSAEALEEFSLGRADKAEIFKKYNAVVAVADVSFTIGPTETFCIMGLSGSGKSTLIRHINRLIIPTQGEIVVDGQSLEALNRAGLRELRSKKIGMVFQHIALFPHKTVLDNVAYGLEIQGVPRKQRNEVAREKLALVQLVGWENRYPSELSGGMQQRVGLARAFATDPGILLMDEPFSALDPLIRRQLHDEFIALSSKLRKTTLFITHDLDEAMRLGSRIAVMRDGRFVQVGTPQDIVLRPADDYVREFTRGVSHDQIITAGAIMEPLVDGQMPDSRAQFQSSAPIRNLIEAASESEEPLIILNDASHAVGLVTRSALLRALSAGYKRAQ